MWEGYIHGRMLKPYPLFTLVYILMLSWLKQNPGISKFACTYIHVVFLWFSERQFKTLGQTLKRKMYPM